MRQRNQGFLADLFYIATKVPWWAFVVGALATYFVLHYFASTNIAAPTHPQGMGDFVAKQLVKIFGSLAQYILPAFILAGAFVSILKRRPVTNEDKYSQTTMPRTVASNRIKREPTMPETDLYALYKSTPQTAFDERPNVWGLELLRSIDWKRFEELCADYFRICGFHAKTQSHGPDGGIDIMLYAPADASNVVNIVQCKRRDKHQVGPKAMRELLGVMTANKVARGTFITSSSFTREAREFAAANGIHVIDGEQLLKRIIERSAEEQDRLMAVATAGDYLTPTCASCGIKMIRRTTKKDKSQFWGCENYPRCNIKLTL